MHRFTSYCGLEIRYVSNKYENMYKTIVSSSWTVKKRKKKFLSIVDCLNLVIVWRNHDNPEYEKKHRKLLAAPPTQTHLNMRHGMKDTVRKGS